MMATVRDGTPKHDLEPADEGARAVATSLLAWEEGEFHASISRELQQLNSKLREHAKLRGKANGEIVLTIKLDCDEYDVVGLTTSYKVKAPIPPRRKTTMWLTPGGNLTAANPKQTLLPLQAVPSPATAEDPDTERETRTV